jgi:outer membrane protein TolC
VRAGRSILEALLGGAPGGEAATRLGGLLEAALGDTLASAPDVAALLAGSPAVRLAELALERARAERALVLAGQRPRISAAAGLQRFEGEDGFVVGPALGLSVSLPGTARAANRTALGAADAAVAAAEARRAATVASVRGALLTALVRYEAARERLALFDAALLRGARQEREAALAAYASGDLSLLELIDFERALARAEIERIRTLTDAADAYAALLSAAAGTGAESESPTLRPTNDDDR